MSDFNYLQLYTETFEHKDYNREGSDSYKFLSECIKKLLLNNAISSILDIGSGRGHVIKELLNYFSIKKITSADLKKFHNYSCEFITLDLSSENLILESFDLITCLDVLEHIEEQHIDNIFKTISKSSKFQILTIANHEDRPYEKHLHLIQKDRTWWESKINQYFEIIETKDVYDCLYGYLLKTKT